MFSQFINSFYVNKAVICGLKTKYLINRDDNEEKLGTLEVMKDYQGLYMILLSGPISPGSYPDEQRLPIAAISAFPPGQGVLPTTSLHTSIATVE